MVLSADRERNENQLSLDSAPLSRPQEAEEALTVSSWERDDAPAPQDEAKIEDKLARFRRLLVAANQVEDIARALLTVVAEIGKPLASALVFLPQQQTGMANQLFFQEGDSWRSQALPPEATPRVEVFRKQGAAYWQAVLSVIPQVCARAGIVGADQILLPWRVGKALWGALLVIPAQPPSAVERALLSLLLDQSAWALRGLLAQGERAALQAQLEQAQRDRDHLWQQLMLAERLAAVGALVSGVAHELNNPLTSVMGFAQLLQLSDLAPEHKADLTIIDNEAQRCRCIVRNLLSLVRDQDPGLEAVPLNEVIQRILELKAYALRNDNVEVALELQPNLPPAWGNLYQLQHVLLNLVNVVHETMARSSGKGAMAIRSEAIQSGGRPWVRVSIANTGPGIAAEIREHLWEPCWKPGQGGGVGLAITKKVVTETGGQLYLDPGYTGGTRFLLELPVSGADLAVAGMPSVATTAPQATVLFVDDELDLAELVERVLGRAGYHVFYALSGAEALQRLAERHYDAVILDLKMPQMSGQDVYEIIQRDYPHLARRVVFTTGDTVSESARAWLEATGSLTLAKPFSIEQLAQMMDMVARRKPVLAGPRRRPA